ncbi:putative autophagy protein atg27 [Erysiphe necator]|uniref:Autophagy-related protein 27 n=1 Tax=Uncinula necator TaxID=52586 RepID=A0A0B1PBF9_UNCNE|nr:putative autophagy protein atg27 [Erysiphe necator]
MIVIPAFLRTLPVIKPIGCQALTMPYHLSLNNLVFFLTFLFPHISVSLGLACDKVIADGITWDLSLLGGPKSVMHTVNELVSLKNTTYTIDICQGLILKEKKTGEKLCPFGSRVCAMERIVNDNTSILERGWPIAGELKEHSGGHIDEKWERLKTSSSYTDTLTEGVKLEMHGGFMFRDDGKKRSQKAVVEFICDHTRNGTENLINPDDEYVLPSPQNLALALDSNKTAKTNENVLDPNLPSLTFVEYNQEGQNLDTLYLSWRTKFACEDAKEQKSIKERHWGFFSWFFLFLFLSLVAYFVFAIWINFNRDGARGWDLLPHSDTIQDIPYLFKDWIRRVLSTLQRSGSRRGYAAV